MAVGKWTHNWKRHENPMLRDYFVSENKIPTAILYMLSGLLFSMAIMFTSPGVAVTPKINMTDKKAEIVSVWQVLLTSIPAKTVIVCFKGY